MEKVVLPNEVMLGEVTRMLEEGREVVLMPKGDSMLPFIRGEIDKVRLKKASTLQVGDIVLAYINDRYILHRIYAIDGEHISLMGDGNIQGTEQGIKSDIKGLVTEIITPKGKAKKPTKGTAWRLSLPIRKYLLKIRQKWLKLKNKI